MKWSQPRTLAAAVIAAGLFTSFAHAAGGVSPGIATEWGRVFERLLIVISGACSMYYGYRLFAVVASSDGQFEAKGGGWRIKMGRIGPGVFFALFGAAIVIYAMARGPVINSANPVDGTHHTIHGAFDVKSRLASTAREEAISAISLIDRLAAGNPAALNATEQNELVAAARALEPIQAMLVDAEMGEGAFADYQQLKEMESLPGKSFEQAMQDQARMERFHGVAESVSRPLGN